MTEELLNKICYGWLGIALLVFIALQFVTAPFGRHTHERWGPSVNNKLGWFLMELPSLAIMVYFLITAAENKNTSVQVMLGLWVLHYTHRTLIYPLRMKATAKKIPWLIVASAIFFNLINAGTNGYYLTQFAPVESYGESWWVQPTTWMGGLFFFLGMYINLKADSLLIGLRKDKETGYKIPRGFLFDWVSTPNLFGEILEWSGFALLAWNLPAFTFMIWTMANLIPRAKKHHEWYLQNFQDYPNNRKIIFPFLY
jgi:3-oxo-5-alpha-steroid 4-dehydrogenase 1